jgi:hypothetical protein
MSLFSARHADGDLLTIAGATVRLRVNPRARRVSLRIDRARAEVVAVAPSVRKLSEAVAFAHMREAWIAGQMADLPAQTLFAPGQALTLFGRPAVLGVTTGRPRRLLDPTGGPDRIVAPDKAGDDHEAWRAAILRLLKREALSGLTVRTALFCEKLGQPLPKIGVADARSRWGSCRPARRGREALIRYSWRVMLAPEAIADYLCAHECAHLVQADHSPAFWTVVRELDGDPAPHRSWLRRHGAALHGMG